MYHTPAYNRIMGKRTSVYLTDQIQARIEQSGMTPLRLIEYALDLLDRPRRAPITPPARPAASTSTRPTSTSTPARITYTAIRDALGQPVGHLFTAADLRAAFGLQTGQWVPRLMMLEACGLIERVGRASTVGRPWQFRLAKVPARRLCAEGECGHEHHQPELATA